jgi:hypothetical protein
MTFLLCNQTAKRHIEFAIHRIQKLFLFMVLAKGESGTGFFIGAL